MTMTPLLTRALEDKQYLVLDGGLATTLELDGHVLDRELWSAYTAVVAPLSVTSVHERFYSAGSDIVITSSYQMSYEGFRKKGLNNVMANQYLRASTAYGIIARETLPPSRRKHAFVASSVGAYGAHLGDGSEYTGVYGVSRRELEQWHAPKLQVLLASGPDLMAFETIPCVDECKALCSLIAQHDQTRLLNGWISFACKSDGQLNSGEYLEDALRVVLDPTTNCKSLDYLGVGINCTNPNFICELLDIMSSVLGDKSSHPVVVYPNKGEIWNEKSRLWENESGATDSQFAHLAAHEWLDRGARILGGCCRTTPDTITCLEEALQHRKSNCSSGSG